MKGYDYVIVGSGTAGSTLAARLTEDPAVRVLVVECGGPTVLRRKLPVGYYKSIYDSRVSHLYRGEPDTGSPTARWTVPGAGRMDPVPSTA